MADIGLFLYPTIQRNKLMMIDSGLRFGNQTECKEYAESYLAVVGHPTTSLEWECIERREVDDTINYEVM